MSIGDARPLRFAVCWRPIPARLGEEHAVTRALQRRGCAAIQIHDGKLPWDVVDVVLILENSRWFPTIMHELAVRRLHGRAPLVAVWHWEPLPLPKRSGIPPPSLSLRERAKIILRDLRATDAYTNLSHLRRLSRDVPPDVLIVSSQAWQESLAEHGIAAHWVPYGYECGDGTALSGPRDIEALFVGAPEVPRRKRLLRQLRRSRVAVVAKGSWFDKSLWGEERTRLINRAEAFINLQRYRGEISAHRLILGMANKALVVSEPIYRPAPFVPGEHYVEAEVADMPEVLRYYRTHRAERERIVEHAHRFVTEELTMEWAVSHILSLLPARAATAAEGSAG